METKKILLIDDEPIFCGNFKSYMGMHGYECDIAANGKEGMEKIMASKPALIILDILMPNMDGYTMLRELKKNNISIPCIVLTAREKLKDLFEMERVSHFISKPVEMAKLKGIVDEVLQTEKKEEKTTTAQLPSLTGRKVLIIEDDVRLGENMKNYLSLQGARTELAGNGEIGLRLCEEFDPEIIISDVMMPEMDGFSMVKRLQKINKNIPVIIVTAKNKLKELFEVEGVAGFISKPFTMGELEDRIKSVLYGE